MAVSKALVAIAAATILSVAASSAPPAHEDAQRPITGPEVLGVAWDERPASVAALDQMAPIVVEAEVSAIETGPDLVAAEPADPSGEDRLPTQRILFSTVQSLEGRTPRSFNLFKTGSHEFHLEGDPAYAVGQRYVLFLRPRGGDSGTYIPVAPDGRLIEEHGEVDGLIDGPIDDALSGKTPEEIEKRVDG